LGRPGRGGQKSEVGSGKWEVRSQKTGGGVERGRGSGVGEGKRGEGEIGKKVDKKGDFS